jgi:hypothetical protein
MRELGERGRGVVREACAALQPTTADRARVRAALAARLGPAPASPTAPRGGGNAPAALGHMPFGVTVGAGVAALAILAGSLVPVRSARQTAGAGAPGSADDVVAAARPIAVPTPDAPAASAVPASSAAGADAAPREIAEPPPRAARGGAVASAAPSALPSAEPNPSSTPARASSLEEEVRLMREAERALAAGDATGALARLDDLSARFEHGVLREERLAARVLALCAAGNQARARAEGERFLSVAPTSPHAGRVRASCAVRRSDGGIDQR